LPNFTREEKDEHVILSIYRRNLQGKKRIGREGESPAAEKIKNGSRNLFVSDGENRGGERRQIELSSIKREKGKKNRSATLNRWGGERGAGSATLSSDGRKNLGIIYLVQRERRKQSSKDLQGKGRGVEEP